MVYTDLPDPVAFQNKINAHWKKMSEGELFQTDVTGDKLWELYLSSFPEGTNPIYRKRTMHDGAYDRQFVRQLGGVVSVSPEGDIITVWDVPNLVYPYTVVAKALSDAVKAAEITGIFRTKMTQISQEKTYEQGENGTHEWTHLCGKISRMHHSRKPEQDASERNTVVQVFERSLKTISVDALEAILELIDTKQIDRAIALRGHVTSFLVHARQYDALSEDKRKGYVWSVKHPQPFRNTAIGTLAIDLSEGMDPTTAVHRFHKKIDPTVYRRPKPVVTETLVKRAMETINELGVEASLERRCATIGDISINDVLWVSNHDSAHLKGGVEDLLKKHAVVKETDGRKISFDDFMKEVAPAAETMELFVGNSMTNRLMSMTTAVKADAPTLFNWDNNLSWTYNGDVTDSIAQRVADAGGKIDCLFRVSLAWHNADDLDLHCISPMGHIFFGNRCGILDVDANGGIITDPVHPVENMAFTRLMPGEYLFYVENFAKRTTANTGFTIEIAGQGKVQRFVHEDDLRHNARVSVLHVKVDTNSAVTVSGVKPMTPEASSKEVWGIRTETYVPVKTILNSPNHWDGQQFGNKHVFFILKDCASPEPVRGIYNEYLKTSLAAHGRVFELLGSKTKAPNTADQLAGIGMTETNNQTVKVRVNGKAVYEVSLV